jgi:hypothetical protein
MRSDSNAPMSASLPSTRGTPRWPNRILNPMLPLSIAELPGQQRERLGRYAVARLLAVST